MRGPLERAAQYAVRGTDFFRKRLFTAAISAWEKSLKYNPHQAVVLSNLGSAYSLAGKPGKSERLLCQAIKADPDFAGARSNLLLSMHYSGRWTPQAIADEHRKNGRAWKSPASAAPLEKNRVRRRLRVGYVSSDFRRHPVACFMEPVLAHHDARRFEIFCYYSAPMEDPTTERLKQLVPHWRPIAQFNDRETADLIRKDRCDILIDLNGHTHGNRLGVFAMKPAPVQATYLGYPNGTGLDSIQYRLTDAESDPPGMTDHLYVEELVRLPFGFLCYRPPDDAPTVRAERATREGEFVFGSLNQYQKISDFTLRLWATILKRVSSSKLLLQSLSMNDPRLADSVRKRIQKLGVDPGRLILESYSRPHLHVYNRIDLALDPFPFHGATTTCEALWMGTPVVTLAGDSHVSRMGVSLLRAAGLKEFIAQTPQDYVRIASEWANDIPALEKLRRGLRRRISQSPLRDEAGFTASFEDCLMRMWKG